LDADYQGIGCTFEAAHAIFDYVFNKKQARRIYASQYAILKKE